MRYEDWPVARLIEREISRPLLVTRYRGRVARPDEVTVQRTRDAWRYSARPPIREANLGPTPNALDRLDGQGSADALRGARECLEPRKRLRDRRKIPVTVLCSKRHPWERRVEVYVSPHLKIGNRWAVSLTLLPTTCNCDSLGSEPVARTHPRHSPAPPVIDPLHSLAFSIHSSPGIYALLVGSGVSTGAGILTGWGITLDLVSKLAEARGESTGSDPAAWYRQEYGDEPNYSELLNALAKTTTERQQLLRGYFEPVDRESDDNQGQPTAAHHAIAGLVAGNYVRVIITTNFDRLLETALTAHGVTPTVLSTPEQVQGALPLIHTRCCIIKLHGDYLDTRIRNTEEELSSYPEEYNTLLDRVFDEFGLVVCGWSADWDNALRSAFLRAPSRRFTTFWAAHGELTDSAQTLVDHRGASVIAIDGADKFFSDAWEQVQAIEQFSRPHPFSVEVAVARLKRYLSEPRFRIRLSDLVDETVERVAAELSSDVFSAQHGDITSESFTDRITKYDAICSILLAMAYIGGRWVEEDHFDIWSRAIQRLHSCRSRQGGMVVWLDMQRYPATLLLYALGLGAIEGNRLTFLKHVLCTSLHDSGTEEHPAVQILPPRKLDTHNGAKLLEGMERHHHPLSDWLHNTLQVIAVPTIRDPERYTLLFDKLEILIALAFEPDEPLFGEAWMPVGAFHYRWRNRDRVLTEIRESIASAGEESPFVASGIFGHNVAECEAKVEQLTTFLARHPLR